MGRQVPFKTTRIACVLLVVDIMVNIIAQTFWLVAGVMISWKRDGVGPSELTFELADRFVNSIFPTVCEDEELLSVCLPEVFQEFGLVMLVK